MRTVVETGMEHKGRNPHPKKDDPLEQRIRRLIADEVYSTTLGSQMFAQVHSLQLDYFKNCLENLDDPNYIHDSTQDLLKRLVEVTNSKIVDGEDNLSFLKRRHPTFALVNHFSAYKLVTIQDKELELDVPESPEIYPFPIFFSSLVPVAQKLEDELYDAHLEIPGSILQIQEAAGLLVIPKNNDVFTDIRKRTRQLISQHPNSLIVIFPEGGTSGKRNMGGPYDLDRFHRGSLAIAQELDIQVIPICQYFNPNSGFELGILPPVRLDNSPSVEDRDARKEYFASVAENTRQQMQGWLNQRIQQVGYK